MAINLGKETYSVEIELTAGGYVLTRPLIGADGEVEYRREVFTSLGAMKRNLNETLDTFKEVKTK